MNIKEYRNKVKGCWIGKNIGGTLGAPFEGYRGVHDIDFYTQNMDKGAMPNDDLDLQLVWLNCAERYGRNITPEILAEYWISYIVANWSEYGAAMNNMKNGLTPPLSAYYNNHNRNSNGAWIRSEIWACLMPGHPQKAVKYAYTDAACDHFGEGMYGEIFLAAVESAAFVESNRDKLIDIGLSYIPKDSSVRDSVNKVRGYYKQGLSWKEARRRLLTEITCSFGTILEDKDNIPEPDIPHGTPGYDAPANIGLIVLGWLYGEGDFGKSICIAAGCAEDGDCTAATLGSILGIIHGADKIPAKWIDPIGDEIKTISINLTLEALKVPKTVTELSERIVKLVPVFLNDSYKIDEDGNIELILNPVDKLKCRHQYKATFLKSDFKDRFKDYIPSVKAGNMYSETALYFKDGINIKEETPLRIDMEVFNLEHIPKWINVRVFMPDSWEINSGREFSINLDQTHAGFGKEMVNLEIIPRNIKSGKTTIVFEISANARLMKTYIPVTLFNAPQNFRKIYNKI